MAGEADNTPLTSEQITSLEAEHGKDVVQRELARQQSSSLPFEPKGGGPDYSKLAPDDAAERIKALHADPDFTARLNGRAGATKQDAAYAELEALAKAKVGTAEGKQAAGDSDYAPESVKEYQMDKPDGIPWGEDAAKELVGIKSELMKAGAHAGVSNALFQQDAKPYFTVSDVEWRGRIESAASKVAAKEGGKAIIEQAEAFLNSGLSPTLLEAAAIASGSEIGIRELARLGRGLSRKAAH